MASQNQNLVLNWVGLSEGGYVNHKDDPGGPTDRGITQKTYDAWNKLKGRPRKTVKGITKTESEEIIVSQYFTPIRFNDLPSGLDYSVADTSVNSGPSRAAKLLQKVLGISQDGVIGTQTLAAIKGKDIKSLIIKYNDARLSFMQSLSTWRTFGKGWTTRVTDVKNRSYKMAEGSTTVPDPISVGQGKTTDNPSWLQLLINFIINLFKGK
jgi:lysozyme family protein